MLNYNHLNAIIHLGAPQSNTSGSIRSPSACAGTCLGETSQGHDPSLRCTQINSRARRPRGGQRDRARRFSLYSNRAHVMTVNQMTVLLGFHLQRCITQTEDTCKMTEALAAFLPLILVCVSSRCLSSVRLICLRIFHYAEHHITTAPGGAAASFALGSLSKQKLQQHLSAL